MNFIYIILIAVVIGLNKKLIQGWSYNPYCWLAECCNQDHIPADVNRLRLSLKQRVYGQHLVDIAVDAIAAHWSPYVRSHKALVLSFHGWPGSGKNYVTKFIAESLFKKGTKSKFVHHFIGRMHFPEEDRTRQYQVQLYDWLRGNITACERQLFIFDEVDKMPSGVLNSIKPLIDYRDVVDGADYTQCIFIFLSNTGSDLINEQYEDYWRQGRQRESLQLKDFEKLISTGAFNEKGGFFRSDTIKSNLIDHYIPFLPMEENHIIDCILDQFRERHVKYPQDDHIKEVLDLVEWGPDSSKLFSKTGCKRISSKVGVLAAKYYPFAGSQTEL